MTHIDHSTLIRGLTKSKVKPGQRYQHYKTGGIYTVLDLVFIEASDELAVLYADMLRPELKWVRPYSDFVAVIEPDKPRFKLLG